MAFPTSPGITTSEIDATTSLPATSVSTGAFVGAFNWGPVLYITPVSTEIQLAAIFSEPDNNTAESFFTCADFLSYSNDLQLIRAQGTGMLNAIGTGGTPFEIDNPNVYFKTYYPTNQANTSFIARYPGSLGNSLKVVVFANTVAFSANASNTADPLYTIANYFSWAPNTTPYVSQVTNGAVVGDELHIAVIDAGGMFTGTANTVLETYQGLSRLSDALTPTGQSNYFKEVLWRQSKYVYNIGIPSANIVGWGNTTMSMVNATPFQDDIGANVSLFTGGNTGVVSPANVITGLGLLSDPAFVDISILMTGSANSLVVNYAVGSIAAVRTDLVVTASPPLVADQDPISPANAINSYVNTLTRSSYLIVDTGYKYRYDKYNDVFRFTPMNGDTAGLMARTDSQKDPWWSPAGLQRGIINNVVSLAYNPGLQDRNALYQNGVNPVVSFPGEGTMLYGDKTCLNYSSAFDRINVRRLFIVLEKTIGRAARKSLFEFNDVFTRAQFVQLVTPFLRTVQGRRGITAFQVVCDGSNNTEDIIDANQFVGDIYVQPARSINYIQLNFVAVGTGVNFSYVVGQVV